jgi:hypothetical protein
MCMPFMPFMHNESYEDGNDHTQGSNTQRKIEALYQVLICLTIIVGGNAISDH